MKLSPRRLVASALASVALVMFAAVAMAEFPTGPAQNATEPHDHSMHDHTGSALTQPSSTATSGAPVPVNPGDGHSHAPSKGELPQQEKAKTLLGQGYTSADVYTALDLERRTGIDALQFLRERKKGTDWPQVVDQIVTDETLLKRDRPNAVDAIQVDPKRLSYYQDQGYTILDVYEAAELAAIYKLDLAEVFTYKTPDQNWRQVEVALQQRDNPIPKDGRMDLSFGEEHRETTATGLHKNEIYRLMDQGYELEEILTADNLTRQVKATVAEILARRSQGLEWNAILQEFPHKELVLTEKELALSTGLDTQTVAALRKQGYSSSDLLRANQVGRERGEGIKDVLSQFEQAGRDWQKVDPPKGPNVADLARTLNVSEKRVEALLQRGATWQEILKAHDRSQKQGKPLDDVLTELIAQRGKRITHMDALYELLPDGTPVEVERTLSGLTLEDVNRLLPEFYWSEIETADRYAAELGVGATKLLESRRQGVPWEEIVKQYGRGKYAQESEVEQGGKP